MLVVLSGKHWTLFRKYIDAVSEVYLIFFHSLFFYCKKTALCQENVIG